MEEYIHWYPRNNILEKDKDDENTDYQNESIMKQLSSNCATLFNTRVKKVRE